MSNKHTKQTTVDQFTLQYAGSEIKAADRIEENIMLLAFLRSADRSLSYYKLANGMVDEYQDSTGINPGGSSAYSYDAVNHLFSPASGGIDTYSKLVLQNEDSFWLDKNAPFWNGTNQSLQLADSADWALGTSDFTFECFAWIVDPVNKSLEIFDQTQGGSDFHTCVLGYASSQNYLQLAVRTTAGGYLFNRIWYAGYTLTANTWYHLAVCRNGSNFRAFINGVQIDTTEVTTLTIPDFSAVVRIGEHVGNIYHQGYYREVRWSKTARYTTTFSIPTVPFVSDSNTLLLLHLSEALGVTTFIDSSSYARTVTNNNTIAGNSVFYDTEPTAKLITPVGGVGIVPYMFNKSAGFFNGTTDYVMVPNHADFNLGTGDFDVECFVNFASFPTNYIIFDWNGGTNGLMLVINSGVWRLYQVGLQRINFTPSLSLFTWHHVRVQRVSGTTSIYINNVVQGTPYAGSDNIQSGSSSLWIGQYSGGGAYYFNGWIKEFRLSNIARTVEIPTAQYVSDSNTKLLLHFDTPATSPLSPAIAFDGTGDFITVAHSTDFNFGTGDFTLEGWFRFNVIASYANLFCRMNYPTNSVGYSVAMNAGTAIDLYINTTSGPSKSWAYAFVTNRTYHIAVVRSSGVFTLYVDGVAQATYSNSGNIDTTAVFSVGELNVGTYYPWNGYVKEVRVSNSARYTTSFTPSQTAFVADSNTKLLIHGDEVNGGDRGAYFAGSPACLTLADSADWAVGSGNFTAESWIKKAADGVSYTVFGQMDSGGNLSTISHYLYITTANYLKGAICTGVVNYEATSTVTITGVAWHHVAMVRYGNILTLYIDGIASGTVDVTGVTVLDSSNLFCIGRMGEYTTTNYFSGSMKWFRFSKGTARYTSNFTPPTSYVNDSYTKLLLPFQEDTQATTFIDYETTPKTVTTVGTTSIKVIFWDSETTPKTITTYGHTVIKYTEDYRNTIFLDSETTPKYPYPVGLAKIDFVAPFGSGVGWMNGTTGELRYPDSTDWKFAADFTIELYFKWLGTIPSYTSFFGQLQDPGVNNYYQQFTTGAGVNLTFSYRVGGSAYNQTRTCSFIANTWYHFACVKLGSNYYMAINGDMGTAIAGSSPNYDYAAVPIFGSWANLYRALSMFDNMRISPTIARYTNTFNPPSADFSTYQNMSLKSIAFTAATTPNDDRLVLYEEDIDAITLNTDLKAYASRDNGTTWTQVTLVNEGYYNSTRRILAGIADISAQPAQSTYNMLYKVETLNNKGIKLYGTAMNWG